MALFVISCDENETTFVPLDLPQDAFVVFENDSFNVTESSTDDVIVTIYLATINQTSNVTVDFAITSEDAILGTHYEIVDNKTQFSIASGKYSDELRIRAIDNGETDGNKELIITLTGNSAGANIGYNGPDSNNSSMSITILDDDCPLVLVGEYNELSEDVNTTRTYVGGSSWMIEATDNPNEYLISGFFKDLFTEWGEVFQEGFGYEGKVLMIDNGDGTVTIPCQYMGQTLPGPWDYSMSGTGTYSSCDKTLTISSAFDDGVAVCPVGWYTSDIVLELK